MTKMSMKLNQKSINIGVIVIKWHRRRIAWVTLIYLIFLWVANRSWQLHYAVTKWVSNESHYVTNERSHIVVKLVTVTSFRISDIIVTLHWLALGLLLRLHLLRIFFHISLKKCSLSKSNNRYIPIYSSLRSNSFNAFITAQIFHINKIYVIHYINLMY